MTFNWNIFRIVADVSHLVSKCILIWSIHSNRSAEGVSLITQIWYLIVFIARYLPMPLYVEYDPPSAFHTFWNFTFKIFYLLSSAYIVFVMMRVYARTRERESAWKMGGATMVGSLVLAPFTMMVFMRKGVWSFAQFSWTFSIILESTCVLPQLLLLRQTTVPTVIDSFYLVTLGSYRAFYILNWIVRGVQHAPNDPISIIFGCIQTALYIDFAWVYFTRQRVKLRGGSVVDSEDLSKGWLVSKILGRYGTHEPDEESVPAFNHQDGAADARPNGAPKTKWGPRGISVSADDTTRDVEAERLNDPLDFEDEGSDDEVDAPPKASAANGGANGKHPAIAPSLVGNGSEWREDQS